MEKTDLSSVGNGGRPEAVFYGPGHQKIRFRYVFFGLVLLSLVFTAPSLTAGLESDDFIHWAILTGNKNLYENGYYRPISPSLLFAMQYLFNFIDPEIIPALKRDGMAPWWADDSLHVAFWRPLASFLHWLDYRLWPEGNPMWMHFHNITLYALLGIMIAFLYRSVHGPGFVAVCGAVLYVINQDTASSISWLACRYAVLGPIFGCATLVLHHRYIGSKNALFLAGGAVSYGMALLSAEAGIATMAYLFCYAVWMDRSPPINRLLKLLPYAVLTVLWRYAYTRMGFAASGSGLYFDPADDIARFAVTLLKNIPVMAITQLGFPVIKIYNNLPSGLQAGFSIGMAAATTIIVTFGMTIIRRRREALFWIAGMVLCLIPSCAVAVPFNRLLFFSSIGGMAFLALLIEAGIFSLRSGNQAPVRRFCAGACIAVILFLNVFLPGRTTTGQYWRMAAPLLKRQEQRQGYDAVPQETESAVTTVIINSPDILSVHRPFVAAYNKKTAYAKYFQLASTLDTIVLKRVAVDTLLLVAPQGTLVPDGNLSKKRYRKLVFDSRRYLFRLRISQAFRDPALRFAAGEKIPYGEFLVDRILSGKKGSVAGARFFIGNTGGANYFYWDFTNDALRPAALPAPGDSMIIAGL